MRSEIQKIICIHLLLTICFCQGCNIINPDETIPSRIQINPFDLQMQDGQGSARHKITDVWVSANSEFVGIYNPPTEALYISDSPVTSFVLSPVIRNNGILSDAIIYPMMEPYVIELPTTPGSHAEVTPVTRYKPQAVFSLIADFETHNEFTDNRDTLPGSMMVRSDVDPFEGNYSGEIIMTPENYIIEVGNSIGIGDLPIDGTEAYLEFHYKSEIAMSIGLLGVTVEGEAFSNFFYVLLPSENWNKIYIELTDQLSQSGFSAYKILFRSFYEPGLPRPAYKIQMDNIKVVHL